MWHLHSKNMHDKRYEVDNAEKASYMIGPRPILVASALCSQTVDDFKYFTSLTLPNICIIEYFDAL